MSAVASLSTAPISWQINSITNTIIIAKNWVIWSVPKMSVLKPCRAFIQRSTVPPICSADQVSQIAAITLHYFCALPRIIICASSVLHTSEHFSVWVEVDVVVYSPCNINAGRLSCSFEDYTWIFDIWSPRLIKFLAVASALGNTSPRQLGRRLGLQEIITNFHEWKIQATLEA